MQALDRYAEVSAGQRDKQAAIQAQKDKDRLSHDKMILLRGFNTTNRRLTELITERDSLKETIETLKYKIRLLVMQV